MGLVGRLDDVARRRDELDAGELIARQAPGAHHQTDASAEREPAHADRRRVAGAQAEAAVGQGAGDRAPVRAAADADARALDRHGVEGGEIEGEAAGNGAPGAVAAAADHDVESGRGRSADRPADVVERRRAHDGVGLSDAGVEASGGVPVGVAREDRGAAERGSELGRTIAGPSDIGQSLLRPAALESVDTHTRRIAGSIESS
jgi:hypothetical protein